MLVKKTYAMLTILNICGETREPLCGAQYTLTNRARQKVTKTTCEKGILRFRGLTNGIYRLEETRPPAGYQRITAVHRVAVCDGRIAVDGKLTCRLTDTSTPLQSNQGRAPAVNSVYAADTVVTGAGRAGMRVTLTFPDGRQVAAKVQANNAWQVCVPCGMALSPGEVLIASQKSEDALGSACSFSSMADIAAAIVIDGPTAAVTGMVSPVAFDSTGCGPAFLEANAAAARLRTIEGYEVMRTQAEPIGFSGEGKFVFAGVPAGQYILYVDRPGFLPCAKVITVKSGAACASQEQAMFRLKPLAPAIP